MNGPPIQVSCLPAWVFLVITPVHFHRLTSAYNAIQIVWEEAAIQPHLPNEHLTHVMKKSRAPTKNTPVQQQIFPFLPSHTFFFYYFVGVYFRCLDGPVVIIQKL